MSSLELCGHWYQKLVQLLEMVSKLSLRCSAEAQSTLFFFAVVCAALENHHQLQRCNCHAPGLKLVSVEALKMSECPLEGCSATIPFTDEVTQEDFCAQTEETPAVPMQPKSLRSLANFTKSPTVKNSSSLPRNLCDVEHRADTTCLEPELEHGATTFIALESDLGSLFGSPEEVNANRKNSHPHQSPSLLSMSFSRSDFEQEVAHFKEKEMKARRELTAAQEREVILTKEVAQLKATVEQLELDSIDLSEELAKVQQDNQRLKEDCELQVQDSQSTVQDLKMNLKEKEDDVRKEFICMHIITTRQHGWFSTHAQFINLVYALMVLISCSALRRDVLCFSPKWALTTLSRRRMQLWRGRWLTRAGKWSDCRLWLTAVPIRIPRCNRKWTE